MNSTALRSGALLITSALLTALPAEAAQKTEFNPSIALDTRYSDNVTYSATDTTSDTVTRVTLELPIESLWKTGSVSFTYKPSYWAYANQTALDRTEHQARLGIHTNVSRNGQLNFSTGYTQTQSQVRPEAEFEIDPDQLLTRRTERKQWAGELTFRQDPGKRWHWEAGLSGVVRNHEEIEGFEDPGTGADVEDRTDFGGSIRSSWRINRKSEIGGRYEHREFSLDVAGDESSDLLSLTYSRSIDRRSTFSFVVGGYRGTGDAAGPDGERSGFHGGFRFERAYDKFDMEFSGRHEPSSGGHLEGTSTNSLVAFSLSGLLPTSRWNWRTGIRYQYRESTNPTQENRSAIGVSARVERLFTHAWGIRVGAGYVNQSQRESVAAEPSALTFNVGVVWYPKGRATSIGERDSL